MSKMYYIIVKNKINNVIKIFKRTYYEKTCIFNVDLFNNTICHRQSFSPKLCTNTLLNTIYVRK